MLYACLFMPPKWWKLNYTDGISEKTSNFSLNTLILTFFEWLWIFSSFTLFTSNQRFLWQKTSHFHNFLIRMFPFSLPENVTVCFDAPLCIFIKNWKPLSSTDWDFSPRLSLLVCKLDKKGLQLAKKTNCQFLLTGMKVSEQCEAVASTL